MRKEIENSIFWEIDYVKKVKENTQKVEENLNKVQKKIADIILIQETLFKCIKLLTLKYKLDERDKLIKLKDRLLAIVSEIWNLSQESQLKVQDIKEKTDKSLSLIRSFYDKTTKDHLTWLWNNEFINNLIQLLWEDNRNFFLVYFDLNDLKKVNDKFWHLAGDMLIKCFAEKLVLLFWEEKNFIARIHWDEFNIITLEWEKKLISKLNKLDLWLENSKFTIQDESWKKHNMPISVAYGYASNKEVTNVTDLIKLADKRMYKNKLKKKQLNFKENRLAKCISQ